MRYGLAALLFLLLPRFLAQGLNGAGRGGVYFGVFLLAAAFVHGAVIACRSRENTTALGVGADLLQRVAHVATLLGLGTLALGVAGFIFNEVFLHRFPNLGFSFLVLAGAGLLCLLEGRRLMTVLSILAAASVAAIATVAAHAIPWPVAVPPMTASPEILAMVLVAAPVLLGADMVHGVGEGEKRALLPAVAATWVGALVFAAMAWAGLLLLDPARLAALSVPQMAIARLALGNSGRMLLGGAGILSTLGGVALLLRTGMGVKEQGGNGKAVRVSIGCGLVGAMLGLGFSGEELTETILTIALALWFAANALTCAACLNAKQRVLPLLGLVGSLVLGAAWVWGSWEHVQYAPYYLKEFLSAHG